MQITEKFHNDAKYINIYTDASMYHVKSPTGKIIETVGCPGAIVVNQNNIIRSDRVILRNSTVNIAELTAINLGLLLASKYPSYGIRLFSDSQLSVFTIRDRIFNYIRDCGDSSILMTQDSTPLKNVTIIMEIITNILAYDIHVDIYHQKGHVNTNVSKDIEHAKNVFAKSNGISVGRIEDSYIKNISYYNNYVDNMTRTYLRENLSLVDELGIQPFTFEYQPFDVSRYKKLIYKEA